ncbi:hypothetical protein GCM10010872_19300 [Dyella flava]|nr:hypothetical protein GCM10010872_19300 [Dyella flava]
MDFKGTIDEALDLHATAAPHPNPRITSGAGSLPNGERGKSRAALNRPSHKKTLATNVARGAKAHALNVITAGR